MNRYLDNTQIKQIADLCNTHISKTNKNYLNKIGNYFNVKFHFTKQINLQLFWNKCQDEMVKKRPTFKMTDGYTFQQAIDKGNYLMLVSYMREFIADNYQQEYTFLSNQQTEQLMEQIRHILNLSFIENNLTITELIEIDNYEKYFTEKYGINSVDKTAINNTLRLTKFIDDLSNSFPNKINFFDVINQYMITGNFAELHNKLNIE